jgi:hypothetical protein
MYSFEVGSLWFWWLFNLNENPAIKAEKIMRHSADFCKKYFPLLNFAFSLTKRTKRITKSLICC